MNKVNLFQKARTGKIQQWSIWVEPKGTSGHPEVWIEHGQVEGKKQLTHDVISKGVNIGKVNETTPLEQAKLTAERKITKQREKGYKNSIEELEYELDIDFNKPLPKALCFYKPNSPDIKKVKELEANNTAVYTIKRDGMMHIIRKSNKFGVEIYSRRMDLVTDKYPHIVNALKDIRYEFILLGEIILDDNGYDNFNGVSQICRSDPEKAIAKQEEMGWVKYYAFDMAYIGEGGKYQNLLTTETYIDRLNCFEDNILCHLQEDSPVIRCEILNYSNDTTVPIHERRTNKSHSEALKEVSERELEGLVVWNADAKMEDGGAFTMNGKAYRPRVLWKSKPVFEDDFIARFDPENGIGEYGKGKNNGKLKSVYLYQLDEDGNEVWLGRCGGGLSDDERTYYTNPSLYPRVWRVKFDSIQDKTGALRFPVFDADRTTIGDKTIEECLLSDASRQAREGESQ